MSESRFVDSEPAPSSGPFELEAAYRHDQHEDKVNLGIGAYRDDEAKPWVLNSVKEARKSIAASNWLHEYLPLAGDESFLEASKKLLFSEIVASNRIASVQTVAGTGANSLIARLASDNPRPKHVWFPDPTWDNHFRIWKLNAPDIVPRQYPYYDANRRRFDLEGMINTLRQNAHVGDAILLHACAHNPTGLDPSQNQWKDIAMLCQEKQLFVVFDVAYQGFASGALDQDAWAVRHFASLGDLDVAACQSFSKNMGLYGERVGALHIVPRSDATSLLNVSGVRSRLIELQRGNVSMAPRFGSEVASRVLSDKTLLQTWKSDLLQLSDRINAMRQALYKELLALSTPGDWTHIIQQKGMFSYTGLTESQVALLRADHHVYMLSTGRISICGLNSGNVQYVAKAIDQVVRDTM